MMWIYVASAMPAFDDTVKVGLTNNCYDRLATFNCPSSRLWQGIFLKVYSDPEAWESELLASLDGFRAKRHYGDSEVIHAKLALNCARLLIRKYADNPHQVALLDWALDGMADLLDWGVVSSAITDAVFRIPGYDGGGTLFSTYYSTWDDLRRRTSRWIPRIEYESQGLKRLVDEGIATTQYHTYG